MRSSAVCARSAVRASCAPIRLNLTGSAGLRRAARAWITITVAVPASGLVDAACAACCAITEILAWVYSATSRISCELLSSTSPGGDGSELGAWLAAAHCLIGGPIILNTAVTVRLMKRPRGAPFGQDGGPARPVLCAAAA